MVNVKNKNQKGEYMDRKENNSVVEDRLEIGSCYVTQLVSGSFLSGILISKGEQLTKEGVQTFFRFMISDDRVIDLNKKEMLSINLLRSSDENKRRNLKEFESKYGAKCFDGNGEILSNSAILGNVIIGKNIWDNVLEKEKSIFVEYLELSEDDIVEILNLCVGYQRENKKLHNKKQDVLIALNEFLKKCNDVKEMFPQFTSVYEWIFRESGIEKLVKVI